MRYSIFIQSISAVCLLLTTPVWAAEISVTTPSEKAAPAISQDTEERAYQESLKRLSDAITTKISEIEAKQKQIDSEIYPAYKPPLEAEKAVLQQQLQDLKLRRDQLQSQKESQEASKTLSAPQPNSTK